MGYHQSGKQEYPVFQVVTRKGKAVNLKWYSL